MLHTNLSSRPFYNTRAVRAALGALAVFVLGVTVLNGVRYAALTGTERELGANSARAESEATRLRTTADAIVRRIDQKELAVVSADAGRANALIDQRTFSWSTLYAQLETVLPEDVRITAVQPRVENDGTFMLSIALQARRVEDVDAFIEALEARGGFRNVLPAEERTGDGGLIEAVIEGAYTAPVSEGAGATTAKTEKGGAVRD